VSFGRCTGDSPIGFSNRLVEIGPNAGSQLAVQARMNQFKVKYIANCDQKGTTSVMDKIRLTDIMKMENIIHKHEVMHKSATGPERR
jgi:hypothetical protein